MTDTLDQLAIAEATVELAATPERSAARFEPSPALLRVAATASLSAAAIHFVMVPSHAGQSLLEGIGFALSGWFQLLTAALLLTRPSRRLLAAVAMATVGFVAVWAWSRTAGLPFGAHAGHAESVGFVDLTTVGSELALLLSCGALAAQHTGRAATKAAGRVAILVMFGVVAVATAAIASPSARDHAAHSHGDDAAGGTHDHVAAGAHDHGVTAVDDKGLSALSNGHHHVIGPEQPLDQPTRAALSRQIALTQQVAAQYPTVAAAEAGGYRRAGPYAPGLGAHYIRPSGEGLNSDGGEDDADLLHPLAIIYAGTDPDSPVAGFMFYAMTPTEPIGFAGPNDHWHYHTNLCLKYGPDGALDAPFGADSDVPADLCARAGGNLLEQTQWMVHVWSVAGWESQQGLFGEVNPALACADGTYYELPLEEWIDHPLDVCRT